MLKKKLLLGLMLGAMASASAQSLATWAKFKNITVNTKASGAGVAANVTNFPVLVRLDSVNANDVFAEALPGGADIRFTNSGSLARPFEIESWDAVAKRAAIWVLADTVKGNDSVVSLRIYWGRAGVTSASNGAAVFDTTNGYLAVWHLNGTTTESSSTAHGFVATAPNDSVPTVNASGAIGRARQFSGTQYFRAIGTAASALNLPLNGKYSLSAWVRNDTVSTTGTNTGHAIVTKGDHQYALAVFGATAAERNYEIATKAGNNQWRQATTAATTTPIVYAGVKANDNVGQWRYVSGSWNGADSLDTARVYFQGAFQKLTTWNNTSTAGRSEARDIHIGVLSNEGPTSTNATGTLQRFHVGSLDEIRISKVLRDSSWMRLEFATQNPAGSVVAVGATQAVTPVAITNVRYNNVGAGNTPRDTLTFVINVPVSRALKYDGGPADSAKITSATATLPAGITLDLTTGLISGTPTALFTAANRTLTVYSSTGNVTRGLIVSVVPGPLDIVKYTNDTVTYTVGVPALNNPVLSTTGRAATGFSVTPALPAGLMIDSVNGAISGTPSAAVAAANYTVKAVNATDTTTHVVRITTTGTAENYSTWTRHRTLFLNTALNSNGGRISGNVRNFPLLVRLGNNDTVFTQALAAGADLRFTKADDVTPLPYQIESWDATAKTAAIWVVVDTVKGNSLTQTIRMHWGKTGATSLSSGSTTFGTNNGFQAVWHMTGGTGSEADATINGFTMAPVAAPADSAGLIGRGRYLDGLTQYFQAANSASGPLNHSMAGDLTLSSWVKLASVTSTAGDGHKIIDKGDNQYVLAVYGSTNTFDNNQHFWEMTIRGNNTWNQCTSNSLATGTNNCTGTATPRPAQNDLGKWVHVLATYKGAPVNGAIAESLYVDGMLISSRQFTHTSSQGRVETFNVSLGAQAGGTAPAGTEFTRFLNGTLDEVRIASTVRSPDWVKLEYENQKADQAVVSTTQPVSIGSLKAANVLAQGFAVKSAGQGLSFQMKNAVEGKAVMTLVDMSGRAVWSGAFAPGSTQLMWNGTVKGGAAANSGLYVARLTVLNNQGQTIQAYDRKVPYTR